MATSSKTSKAKPKKKDDDPRLVIPYKGVKQTIRMGSLTAAEEQVFYAKTGLTFAEVFFGGKVPSWGFAGISWIHNRKRDASLRYEDVVEAFVWTDIEDCDWPDEADDRDAPEA